MAHEQMKKGREMYVPPEIRSCTDGGSFIHEGNDNIDINAETSDGKNTFHAKARVDFQQIPKCMELRPTSRVSRKKEKNCRCL